MKRIVLLVFTLCVGSSVFSQVFSNKEVGKKNADKIDSLKNADYPYVLPIWGAKATKAGFSLPYSAGLSVQYLWQESDLVIENLMIGFNNQEMHNLDNIIDFNSAKSRANAVNLRPDIWLFPFLNVYGVLAKSALSTDVGFNVNLPDSNGNLGTIASFNTQANFNASTLGFGVTPTIGVGGGWMAFDMNFSWNDIPELNKPAFAFVFGPRMGKSFKLKKPNSNIALWTGAFRLHLNSGTSGNLAFSDLFDMENINTKIDNGQDAVESRYLQNENWWNGLSPIEQKNPINKAKYEATNKALDEASNFLTGMEQAVNKTNNSTVQYSLDKRPKNMWNFLIGSQYQINKSWMLRAEYGFLGSRTQFIGGLQYRFGL